MEIQLQYLHFAYKNLLMNKGRFTPLSIGDMFNLNQSQFQEFKKVIVSSICAFTQKFNFIFQINRKHNITTKFIKLSKKSDDAFDI